MAGKVCWARSLGDVNLAQKGSRASSLKCLYCSPLCTLGTSVSAEVVLIAIGRGAEGALRTGVQVDHGNHLSIFIWRWFSRDFSSSNETFLSSMRHLHAEWQVRIGMDLAGEKGSLGQGSKKEVPLSSEFSRWTLILLFYCRLLSFVS